MLVGIGLGPGDPELITIKAIKTIKQSKKVYVPGRIAAKLVEPYADAEILEFPMIQDKKILAKYWKINADIIAKDAEHSLVSFCSVGDPNFFSTFNHIRRVIEENYPNVIIKTIPGVSSITAFASRINVGISESFEVSDGSIVNSKIILKAKKINIENLKKEGYTKFILAKQLFSENESVITLKDSETVEDYFSILYAKKG
ncbi:MAG: cobalt-factor II C(20)-methyltransferase [Methanosarcinales archaeon]